MGFDVAAEPIVIAEDLPGRDRARHVGTIPYRLVKNLTREPENRVCLNEYVRSAVL